MKKFLIALLAAGTVAAGAEGFQFKWKTVPMDGSRTGVTIPTADNAADAIGTVSKGVYTAPNGKVYKGGSTPAVAQLMLDAQPSMAPVKEVIGYSDEEMTRRPPQCALSNWFIDILMELTETASGKPVDIGIYNFGGIRCDMPAGQVTVDDIMSMFPFNNYPTYVALKGSDVKAIFDFMAETHPQVVGGVQFVVKDHKTESLLVGGRPLDPKKTYGVATIDFLLNGGDGLKIAKNAEELIITDKKVSDVLIPYIKQMTAEGKTIHGSVDDRVTILKEEEESK